MAEMRWDDFFVCDSHYYFDLYKHLFYFLNDKWCQKWPFGVAYAVQIQEILFAVQIVW